MNPTTYTNFTLIDVVNQTAVPDCLMTVEGDRIKNIGPAAGLTPQQRTWAVDLSGKAVMPGMFNCHIHALSTPIAYPATLNHENPGKFAIRGMKHLEQHLHSGVTFARDMNGRRLVEMDLRECLRQGLIQGPDLMVCRQALCITGGHGWTMSRQCDGPDEVRRAVREQIRGGADFIKLMATGGVMTEGAEPGDPHFCEEEIRAAVETAHMAGKRVACHAQGTQGILNCLRAGADCIEHGTLLDDRCLELMVKNGTHYVPTLTAVHFIVTNGTQGGIPAFAVEKAKRFQEISGHSFLRAWKAGVKIGCGTDAGTPYNRHDASYMELVLMVKAGITPMEAIVAATINAAQITGVQEEQGSLEPGKKANFLVLDTNPLERIDSLAQVGQVYKDGKPVSI